MIYRYLIVAVLLMSAYGCSDGSNDADLHFNDVPSVDFTESLSIVATSSLALNGGTILDGNSNIADLTLASPGAANSLGANKALVVDGVVPSVSNVTSATADGTHIVGDVIGIQIVFDDFFCR